MTQYARPASDITNSTWTTLPTGGQSLYAQVDEASYSDTDYIRATGNSQTCEIKLSSVSDPLSSSNHVLSLRAKATGSSAAEKWTVTIYQGATLIATAFNAGTVARTTFNAYSYTLTATEADAITNYGDLRVRIVVTQAAGETIDVSWIELAVPDITPTTVTLTAAALTAGGQAVTIDTPVAPTTVSLNAAGITAGGQAAAVLLTYYEIQRHPGDNNWQTIATLASSASTYDDSASLVNGTTYSYQVRLVTNNVAGPWSNTVSIAYSSGLNVSLAAASLAASGQAVTVVPGAVSTTLAAAALSASGQTVTVSAPIPPTTVVLNAATLTAGGQSAPIIPGAVSVVLGAASLVSAGQTLTPVPGAVSTTLAAAGLTASGQALTVTAPPPGAQIVTLNAAALSAAGQTVSISAPAPGLVVTLNAAAITTSGQAVTAVPGAVSVSLSGASLAAAGQTITPSLGGAPQTVSLNAATLTASGQSAPVVPGTANVALNAAGLTASPQPVTILPGAVTVALAAAHLAAAGQAALAAIPTKGPGEMWVMDIGKQPEMAIAERQTGTAGKREAIGIGGYNIGARKPGTYRHG